MQIIKSINKQNFTYLKEIYGIDEILNYIKKIVHQEEKKYMMMTPEDQSEKLYEIQYKLWERYGYFFSILHYYPFYNIIVKKIKASEKNSTSNEKLSIEKEVQYGFQLLAIKYITFLDENSKLDVKKIFNNAKSEKTKEEIIHLFQNFYKNYLYESNYDKWVKEFILNAQKQNKTSSNQIIDEELIDEVKLYLDYRIAKYEFLVHNQGLIGYTLKSLHIDNEIEKQDLYQEGILGLDKATEVFDIRKCYKFSTYAFYWIKQAIQYEIMRNKTIAIPYHINHKNYKIMKTEEEYIKKYGKKPTINELSILTELSEKEILETKLKMQKSILSSLNQPIVTNEGNDICTIEECIPDENAEFENKVIDSEMTKQIFEFLSEKLSEREYQILLLKSGIGVEKPMTQKEIGDLLGITHQRVQQIYTETIEKLQKSWKVKRLNPYK